MTKIPVGEAVSTGAWFECKVDSFDGKCTFRFRVISFEQIDLNEIDAREEIELDLTQGWLYLMKYEIVNLGKEEWSHISTVSGLIQVIDQDGCIYGIADDDHIQFGSSFADSSGLSNEYKNLFPKMKKLSAMLFYLPIEEGATYFLSVDGDIREV